MTRTTIQTATRTVIATATGRAATGYWPQVRSRNGRVIWEASTPSAFADAAVARAEAYAAKMD